MFPNPFRTLVCSFISDLFLCTFLFNLPLIILQNFCIALQFHWSDLFLLCRKHQIDYKNVQFNCYGCLMMQRTFVNMSYNTSWYWWQMFPCVRPINSNRARSRKRLFNSQTVLNIIPFFWHLTFKRHPVIVLVGHPSVHDSIDPEGPKAPPDLMPTPGDEFRALCWRGRFRFPLSYLAGNKAVIYVYTEPFTIT